MAQKSLDLINAMAAIAKDAQPITGRGVGYGRTAWVPYHHVGRTYEYDADAPAFTGPASGTCRT